MSNIIITGSALTKNTDINNLANDWQEVERELRLLDADEAIKTLIEVVTSD